MLSIEKTDLKLAPGPLGMPDDPHLREMIRAMGLAGASTLLGAAQQFRRGDSDASGVLNITDAIPQGVFGSTTVITADAGREQAPLMEGDDVPALAAIRLKFDDVRVNPNPTEATIEISLTKKEFEDLIFQIGISSFHGGRRPELVPEVKHGI